MIFAEITGIVLGVFENKKTKKQLFKMYSRVSTSQIYLSQIYLHPILLGKRVAAYFHGTKYGSY